MALLCSTIKSGIDRGIEIDVNIGGDAILSVCNTGSGSIGSVCFDLQT